MDFMKKLILIPILITFVTLSSQCSSNKINSNSQTANVNLTSNSNSTASQLASPDIELRARRKQALTSGMAAEVKNASNNILHIPNLRDIKLTDKENELRVWFGFGLVYPHCFILKNLNGKREAFYHAPRVINGKGVFDAKGKIIFVKTILNEPKEGWDNFEVFLRECGVDSTIKLSPENEDGPDPDETFVIIEVKSGQIYDCVLFPTYSKTVDGQKASSIWQRIKQEFDVGK